MITLRSTSTLFPRRPPSPELKPPALSPNNQSASEILFKNHKNEWFILINYQTLNFEKTSNHCYELKTIALNYAQNPFDQICNPTPRLRAIGVKGSKEGNGVKTGVKTLAVEIKKGVK